MSRIKECFISRWGDAGMLVEVDFSQLEVVALAILSGDSVLRNDLLSGMDMHRVRAAELYGIPEAAVNDQQRTIAKRLSFQLQYGAGAKSMAAKNNIPKELAQRFIDNYYARYTGVKAWQDGIAKQVKASRKPSDRRTAKGIPAGVGEYVSPTGRIYRFYEYDAPEWSKECLSFSPTEMKNYPIQGFATADVMAVFRGNVVRKLLEMNMIEFIVPINTVHDSVMFDVHDGYLPTLDNVVEWAANNLPNELERRWPALSISLPFKYTIHSGPSWAAL